CGIDVFPVMNLAVEDAFGCGQPKFDDDHTRVGDDSAWCGGDIAADCHLGFHEGILSCGYSKEVSNTFQSRRWACSSAASGFRMWITPAAQLGVWTTF